MKTSSPILIVCALRAESQPIATFNSLSLDISYSANTLYSRDDMSLLETGIGKINAAIALTRVLERRFSDALPLILNVGLCGAPPRYSVGSLLLVNKIEDVATRRCYFPEMLVRSDIAEVGLCSVDRPVPDCSDSICVYDMEAAGIFEAATRIVPTTHVSFLKIVSDHGTAAPFSEAAALALIQPALESVSAYVSSWRDVLSLQPDNVRLDVDELAFIEKVAEKLRLTHAQRSRMHREMISVKGRGAHVLTVLSRFNAIAPAQSKAGNRNMFGEICRALATT